MKKVIISSIILSNVMAQAPQNINNYLYSQKYQTDSQNTDLLNRLKEGRDTMSMHRTSAEWMKAIYDGAELSASALPLGTGFLVGSLAKLGQRVTNARVVKQEAIYTQKVKDVFFEISQKQREEFNTTLEISSPKERAEALIKLAVNYATTDEQLSLKDSEKEKLAYQLGKNSLEVAMHIAKNQSDFIEQQGQEWDSFKSEVSEDFEKLNEVINKNIEYDLKQDKQIEEMHQNITEFEQRYNSFSANLKAKVAAQQVDISINTERINSNRAQININREMIKDLSENVFDNKISIDELENSVSLLQDDVEFNQMLIFDDLSASRKLAALDNPRFLSEAYPDGEQRNLIKEKLELVKTRVEIAEKSQSIAQGASDILKIADNLGFKGKNSKEIKEALQYGIAAANITASIASGNYLGAAVAITGLLGKKSGPSAEELRHQEIMRTLGIIDEKLDTVLENQRQIYLKLEDIEKQIIELGTSIKEVERNLLTEIGFIKGDLAFILNMLNQNDQTVRKLDLCSDFLQSRTALSMDMEQKYSSFVISYDPSSLEEYMNFNKGYFVEWEDLKNHYNDFKLQREFSFKSHCIYPLQTLFTTSRDKDTFYNSPLLMGSYVKDSTSLNSQVLTPVYNPLLTKLFHLYPVSFKLNDTININKAIKAYMTLSTKEFSFLSSYDDYEKHIKNEGLSKALDESDDINSSNVEIAMKNILHPPKVIKYGHMLLETIPYHDLVTREDKLISQSEIDNGNFNNGVEETFTSLKKLIPIINTAMAQQQVFSGMLLLERLHQDIIGTNGENEKKATLAVLKKSPILLKNYIRHRIYSDLITNRRNSTIKGNDSIESVFLANLNKYSEDYKSGKLHLNDIKKELGGLLTKKVIPDPASLQELKYLQTAEYYELKNLKMEVFKTLSYYPLNTKANIELISYSLPYGIFKTENEDSQDNDTLWDFWN